MAVILRVGQVLRVCREHFAIGPRGIVSLFPDDLLLVVDSINGVQAAVLRLGDGEQTHIVSFSGGLDILGAEMSETYVEVPMEEIES